MKKYTPSEADHGRTVQETHGQQSLISIQHNAAIIAARLDSDVQRTLRHNYVKHTETRHLLRNAVSGESARLWQRRTDVGRRRRRRKHSNRRSAGGRSST